MKRLVILLSLVTLTCVLIAIGGTPRGAGGADQAKKYIIHLKDGGKLQTDNYTVEGRMVKIMLPSGAISLDKSMIKSIEEVRGEEGSTMQKVFGPTAPKKEPEKKGAPPGSERPVLTPGRAASQTEPTDDKGHPESWWRQRVSDWQKKMEDARNRYREAKAEWDNYNGILLGQQSVQNSGVNIPALVQVNRTTIVNGKQVVVTTGTTTVNQSPSSQFDITKYQDLRGAARVKMDAAEADIAEAKRMLEETLPDEARKAGAPPGWVR